MDASVPRKNRARRIDSGGGKGEPRREEGPGSSVCFVEEGRGLRVNERVPQSGEGSVSLEQRGGDSMREKQRR